MYKSDEKPKIDIEIDEVINYMEIKERKGCKLSKSHYTEASLIKHMDELGVGRPDL